MKKLILTSTLGAAALALSACGDNDTETVVADDTTAATDAATVDTTSTATTASANWPAGTRIVQEGDTYYRIDPNGTRVVIDDGTRIVTEDGVRYRVDPAGTRVRIDDDGIDLDVDTPDGLDVDVGTNANGNLDVDVSTDGEDATR